MITCQKLALSCFEYRILCIICRWSLPRIQ